MKSHPLWAALFCVFFSLLVSAAEETDSTEPPAPDPEKIEREETGRFRIPIVYYTPETSVAGGLLFIQNFGAPRDGRTSHLIASFSVTAAGQYFLNLAPKFYSSTGIGETGGTASYRYYPSKFFGRGLNFSTPKGERYVERGLDLNLTHAWNFHDSWSFRIGALYDRRKLIDFEAAGLVASEVSLIGDDSETIGGSLGFEWDTRDFPQAPQRGQFFRLSGTHSQPRDLSGIATLMPLQKGDLDLRFYHRIRSDDTWAHQILISEVRGDLIPFQSLNSVGGGSRLRGFYAGRFRDRALSLYQTEWRHEFTSKWVGTTAIGAGRLASTLPEIPFAKDLVAGSIGVQYIVDPRNRTKIRADIGFAQEPGFYLLIGEAF